MAPYDVTVGLYSAGGTVASFASREGVPIEVERLREVEGRRLEWCGLADIAVAVEGDVRGVDKLEERTVNDGVLALTRLERAVDALVQLTVVRGLVAVVGHVMIMMGQRCGRWRNADGQRCGRWRNADGQGLIAARALRAAPAPVRAGPHRERVAADVGRVAAVAAVAALQVLTRRQGRRTASEKPAGAPRRTVGAAPAVAVVEQVGMRHDILVVRLAVGRVTDQRVLAIDGVALVVRIATVVIRAAVPAQRHALWPGAVTATRRRLLARGVAVRPDDVAVELHGRRDGPAQRPPIDAVRLERVRARGVDRGRLADARVAEEGDRLAGLARLEAIDDVARVAAGAERVVEAVELRGAATCEKEEQRRGTQHGKRHLGTSPRARCRDAETPNQSS